MDKKIMKYGRQTWSSAKKNIRSLHQRLNAGAKAFKEGQVPHQSYDLQQAKLAKLGKYILKTCYIYYDDTSSDDPALTPSGKHLSRPINSLAEFKKYFNIEPKSDLGYTKPYKKGK